MSQTVLFTVLFLSPHITAQTLTLQPSPPPPRIGYSMDTHVKISPSMAIVLVCLITSFLIMGCASVYVRHCSGHPLTHHRFLLSPHYASLRSRPRGIDPTIIETFPIFLYSDVKGLKIGLTALECAVCLNEFDDNDTLRLLPKCWHVFHPHCIDSWLASHITCPLCRANLIPKPGERGLFQALDGDIEIESRDTNNTHDLVGIVNDLNLDIEATPEVINPCHTPSQNRPPRSTPRKIKTNWNIISRSHSTGHSLTQHGDDYERFTLRLPEEVRNRFVQPTLIRAKSCVAFPRARSERKGYRSNSSGSTGRGGRSYPRFNGEEQSSRPGIVLTPNRSATATPMTLLRSVKSPFDRLFGGRDKDKDNVGERSFDLLTTDGEV